MADAFPLFGVFPALRLAKDLELGDWCIGTPPATVSWRSDRFRELSLKLVESFKKSGFKEECPMLWHRSRGFDGTAPDARELGALVFAVNFVVLDANDQVAGDDNVGMYLATVENADLFLQPIDETDGRITHRRGGGLRSVSVAGPRIGGDPPPLSDAVLPLHRPLQVSRKVAKAIFELLRAGGELADRVGIALEWHGAAMANSHSVTTQQRVIALKTAFEALTGTSESRETARRIRSLFESATAAHSGLLPWKGVLWAPNERTNLQRPYMTKKGKVKQDVRSELEDCMMALADVRNAVIHKGRLLPLEWSGPVERPLSRYAGNLFWKGERILREAIKAALGGDVLLCGPIARKALWQTVADEVNRARTSSPAAEPPPSPALVEATPAVTYSSPVEPPPRDLATLLAELKSDAANRVTIETLGGFTSASEEAAIEMANNAVGKWGATAGPVTMMITDSERAILEQAGAEEEVPDYWAPCE
jgi:hypothetical protein